jgi:uncharacterized ParB-like nuclease family protein
MFANLEFTQNNTTSSKPAEYEVRLEAVKFFNHAYQRGQRGQLWSKISGKQNHLETLSTAPVSSQHASSKVVSVPIQQIKGTLGRNSDFDASFNPLKEGCRTRWINVYTAFRKSVSLPPVELVKVDNAYYVRDGHHRISVLKAFGQETIDAQIVN